MRFCNIVRTMKSEAWPLPAVVVAPVGRSQALIITYVDLIST